MGYGMSQQSASFFIAASDFDKALATIKVLRGKPPIAFKLIGQAKISDEWGNQYNFIEDGFWRRDTLPEIFKAWCWPVELDEDGNICGIQFGRTKRGDDFILFQAVAPFVRKGSFIAMTGEDGARWCWRFDGKTCLEVKDKS